METCSQSTTLSCREFRQTGTFTGMIFKHKQTLWAKRFYNFLEILYILRRNPIHVYETN